VVTGAGQAREKSVTAPTPPNPRVPPAVVRQPHVSVTPCDYGPIETTCRAEARWGDLYSTVRDVTDTATWLSSDPAVLRANGPHLLNGGATGFSLRVAGP